MCIDINNTIGRSLWSTYNFNYLREHPLLKSSNEFYLALNPNLIVDRMYQALKFVIFDAMLANGAVDSKCHLFVDRPTFFGKLGNDFSESNIFYTAIEKAFSGVADVMFSGTQLKIEGVVAEPDYYVRIGKSLLLFEYKDVTLSDKVKQSYDYETVKNEILDRVCKDDGKTRKGVGQLLFSANEILNNISMSQLDPESSRIESIYPIVVTTDRSFNSLGIQHLVIEATSMILPKYSFSCYTSNPIILNFDDLLLMSKKINNGQVNFVSLLNEFNRNNINNLSSFSAYITDHHRDWIYMSEDDRDYIFSELINEIENRVH